MRGRWVASYAIQGVQLSHPTKQWARKAAAYREQYAQREEQVPEVFKPGSAQAVHGSWSALVAVDKAMRSTVHEVERSSVHEVMRFHTTYPDR